MKEKLAKLIDVKSIMTLMLTIVFCVLALCGVISGQEFLTIFTVVVGFYFGTQATKKAADADARNSAEPVGSVIAENAAENNTDTVDAATYSQTHPDSDTVVTGVAG